MNTMNTHSNAVPDTSLDSSSVTRVAAVIPKSHIMYWAVRRELWENRSIYIAPLAVAALSLIGFLISLMQLPAKAGAALALHNYDFIEQPLNFSALLIMGTTLLVAIFYCLDALYGERRDRSILFWKSLPVSDLTTLLAKASIPLLILPLITFTVTVATQWIMMLLNSAVLLSSGVGASLWSQVPLFQMWAMLLFHLVAVHGLYYAPIYGWLLLVSGWARRAPFVWAVLPLLAIVVFEKIAFNTSHFGNMLVSRISGGGADIPFTATSMSMDSMTQVTLARFLISPGLWIGLAVAALFLAAAVRLRRYQGPI